MKVLLSPCVLQAQRFLALVLLPHVRQDIEENKRCHFALFQAMKKATYKPDAFFKVSHHLNKQIPSAAASSPSAPLPRVSPTLAWQNICLPQSLYVHEMLSLITLPLAIASAQFAMVCTHVMLAVDGKSLLVCVIAALCDCHCNPCAVNVQGLLLPLCQAGDCNLREAVIVSSVLKRVSLPVLHSAAALLRIADMAYSGTNSFFIRVLLDKKYALPYRVVSTLYLRCSKRRVPKYIVVSW